MIVEGLMRVISRLPVEEKAVLMVQIIVGMHETDELTVALATFEKRYEVTRDAARREVYGHILRFLREVNAMRPQAKALHAFVTTARPPQG